MSAPYVMHSRIYNAVRVGYNHQNFAQQKFAAIQYLQSTRQQYI